MSLDDVRQEAGSSGRFRSSAATHVGTVRSLNQDGFVHRPDLGLWAVADGAGGHAAGEVASGLIVDALQALPPELPPSDLLLEVQSRLGSVHETLRETSAQRAPGTVIASTVVVLLAHEDHFACLWAGDSRGYLWREGGLLQITHDHSLVQDLLDAGAITEEAAERHPHANIVTRALGAELEAFSLDKQLGVLVPGDRLMICSDGLTKALSDAEIVVLLSGAAAPDAQGLVAAALERGARDNVTAVVVEVESGGVIETGAK